MNDTCQSYRSLVFYWLAFIRLSSSNNQRQNNWLKTQ